MALKRTIAAVSLPFALALGCAENREPTQPGDSYTTRATRGLTEMAEDAWAVVTSKAAQIVDDPATYEAIQHGTKRTLDFAGKTAKAIGQGTADWYSAPPGNSDVPSEEQPEESSTPDFAPGESQVFGGKPTEPYIL